jgi:hypothetical protein
LSARKIKCRKYFFFLLSAIASDILNTIDESVSPCDDFYHFSCGSWIRSTNIPEETGFTNIFAQSSQRLNIELKSKEISPIFYFKLHNTIILITI